jgi:phenylpropionate dioxygenase-like ring-hydroxylating dioxygenase large terminal subunit
MNLHERNIRFKGFANVWTPVLGSGMLKEKPYPLMLAGEKLVLFRGLQGASALIDRCPHRGVALSLGRVREGCLECPFHGWRFDGQGEVTSIPWNANTKELHYRTEAIPTVEVGGVIWVYTAIGVAAPELPYLAKKLAERGGSVVKEKLFHTHWTRAMENALDAPHLPFVHRKTIGIGLRKKGDDHSVMETSFTDTEYGGRVSWWVEGSDFGGHRGGIDFFTPNVMHLLFSPKEEAVPEQLMAVVPVDEQRTRMISILQPGFSLFNFLNSLIGARLLWEDQRVVESSYPLEIPEAGHDLSVKSDKATLAFRKYYDRVLRHSGVEVPPTPVAFNRSR